MSDGFWAGVAVGFHFGELFGGFVVAVTFGLVTDFLRRKDKSE